MGQVTISRGYKVQPAQRGEEILRVGPEPQFWRARMIKLVIMYELKTEDRPTSKSALTSSPGKWEQKRAGPAGLLCGSPGAVRHADAEGWAPPPLPACPSTFPSLPPAPHAPACPVARLRPWPSTRQTPGLSSGSGAIPPL